MGAPPPPTASDTLCSTLDYTLTREDSLFYLHPLGTSCVAFDRPFPLPDGDPSRQKGCAFYVDRTPVGPCMHCGVAFSHDKFFQARDQDRVTGAYALWGNFHSFACALGYAFEEAGADAWHIVRTTQRMAFECFGYDEPIRPAPPRICLRSNMGHVPDEAADEAARSSSITVHQTPFIAFAMMIECQNVPGNGAGGLPRADQHNPHRLDARLRWNVRGLRAPEIPGLFGTAPKPAPGAAPEDPHHRRHLVAMQPDPRAPPPTQEGEEGGSFDAYVRDRLSGGGDVSSSCVATATTTTTTTPAVSATESEATAEADAGASSASASERKRRRKAPPGGEGREGGENKRRRKAGQRLQQTEEGVAGVPQQPEGDNQQPQPQQPQPSSTKMKLLSIVRNRLSK
jgi:hypothetical protein